MTDKEEDIKMLAAGFQCLDKEKLDDALLLFNGYLIKEPNDVRALGGKANCLNKMNKNKEALEICLKAFEIDSNNKGVRQTLSAIYYALGMDEELLKLQTENVKMFPDDPKELYWYSEILLLHDRLKEAEEQIMKVFELLENQEYIDNVDLGMFHQQLGIIYVMRGKAEESINEFIKSVRANKNEIFSIKLLDASVMLNMQGNLINGNPQERRNRLFAYAERRSQNAAYQTAIEKGALFNR